MSLRKIGIEEELMLVDPATGYLTAVAGEAIRAQHEDVAAASVEAGGDSPAVEPELFRQQVETQTPPCDTLTELDEQLRRSRRVVGESARAAGASAVAVAAPILIDEEAKVTPQPRYRRIRKEYGELARSSLVCAMHVHVDITDEEEGVTVIDGIAPWLPVLLAISANSPYFHGRDTEYASWRSQIWTRWPTHGTGEPFESAATYREVTERLKTWGAGFDDGMIYFDTRLSRTYPTVEVRVADVCTEVEDTLLLAALTRALVTSTAGAATISPWRSDLLRAAAWRASRYGIAELLVDPETLSLGAARDVIGSLIHHVRPALEEADDLDVVQELVERLLARGNGAIQQRRRFEATGSLEAVVDDACSRTAASWQEPSPVPGG